MRQKILMDSVRRLLASGERLDSVVYMWNRHRWAVPYMGMAFIGMVGVSLALGFETWSVRVGLGAAAAAVAATATTNYRVLAETSDRLIICRSSRIRHYATRIDRVLATKTPIQPVAGNLLVTDWLVGDIRYSIRRASNSTMTEISLRQE